MAGGVEYQVTKVDPTDPETKGMVHQVHKVSEEIAATIGGKVYRARIINDPTAPTVAGKVYQIVLIDDPDDPSVKGMVYNAILTGGSEAVVVGPAVSPLSLPDAVAGNLDYVKAFGGTEQNGTPTPTVPVDIVSNNGALKYSANMANVNAQTVLIGYYISAQGVVTADANNWIYQDYIPVKPNTTYTLTMSSSVYYVTISEYSTADDSGFVIRKAGSSGANTTLTITTGATTNFIRFGTNIDRSEVTLDRVLAINWMLNVGDSMSYTPYVEGGFYTDGTVETIGVYGNNLIDLSAVTDGYYYDAQGNYTSLSAARLTDYIPVEAGKDVKIYFKSLSTISTLNVRINIFNSNKVWQSQEVLSLESLSDGTKIITPTYNGYIRVSGNYSGGAIVDWNAASITESLGSATTEMLLAFDTTRIDEQEIISGVITRKVGVIVFDGTENWVKASNYTDIFYTDAASDAYYNSESAERIPVICTHLQGTDATNTNMVDNTIKLTAQGAALTTPLLYVKASVSGNDLTTWQNWLATQYAAGTPVIVVYPLETATTESVAGQTLQVQDGDNTLEITQASLAGLKLEAEYEKESV